MDTKQRLAELSEYAEEQADIINENLCNAFTQLCRDVVADWSRRYPRHKFRIWEGHGMISTDISPPLGYHKDKEWEGIVYCSDPKDRGAIGQLSREANALHSAFDDLNFKVQFTIDGVIGHPL